MWDVIIGICLVLVVCMPIWLVARYLQIKLPKYIFAVIAGVSLLGFNTYMRYTWMDRMTEAFPPEVVVLKEYRSSSLIEPWTHLVPRITHFIAADTTQTRTNPDFPEIIMGETVMMQEHQETLHMTVLVNCEKQEVSILPANSIAKGQNPMDLAQWSASDEFSFITAFYCKK